MQRLGSKCLPALFLIWNHSFGEEIMDGKQKPGFSKRYSFPVIRSPQSLISCLRYHNENCCGIYNRSQLLLFKRQLPLHFKIGKTVRSKHAHNMSKIHNECESRWTILKSNARAHFRVTKSFQTKRAAVACPWHTYRMWQTECGPVSEQAKLPHPACWKPRTDSMCRQIDID